MNSLRCPECRKIVDRAAVRTHIQQCVEYVPTYLNSLRRTLKSIPPETIFFVSAEIDIIREELLASIDMKNNNPPPNSCSLFPQKQVLQHPSESKKQLSSHKHNVQANNGHKVAFDNQQSSVPKKPFDEYLAKRLPAREQINKNNAKVKEKRSFTQLFGESLQGVEKKEVQVIWNEQQQVIHIQCARNNCEQRLTYDDGDKYCYLDECLHTICLKCARSMFLSEFVVGEGKLRCPKKECSMLIPLVQVRAVLGEEQFNRLQNELTRKGMNLIKCNKCSEEYQFVKGRASDAPKKTDDGRQMSTFYASHFADNRFKCPQCKSEQCRKCGAVPYHLGASCEEFKANKLKKKCRYCLRILPPGYMNESSIAALDDICDDAECEKLAKVACTKILPCKHVCNGVIREKQCLPCLNEKCALQKTVELLGQNEESYCSLCYIEALSQSPCVRSTCGHIFHEKCLKRRLQLKWGTPRIFFKFCECPLCSRWLQFPANVQLDRVVGQLKQLHNTIREKSMKRLKYQGNDKDSLLTDKGSPYYMNEEKYAMTIYAYFCCYKCKIPYFGGRKNCAEAMNEGKDGHEFDQKQLVCPSCCPVAVASCKRHGKEYISFKCKFCCSIAQWFCWGNTHFCDKCHKKQISASPVSKLPREKLPKCQGKGKCPAGGEHGPNGEQLSLGCALCRKIGDNAQDF